MITKRLEAMTARAYALATQVLCDEPIDHLLAREISGECAELLALLDQDWGSFSGPEVIDPELLQLANWVSNGVVRLPRGM